MILGWPRGPPQEQMTAYSKPFQWETECTLYGRHVEGSGGTTVKSDID